VKPSNEKITAEALKKYPGLGHLTDQQAIELLERLNQFADILLAFEKEQNENPTV
jgi:hypothetical protein